jgi:hypothetical protein
MQIIIVKKIIIIKNKKSSVEIKAAEQKQQRTSVCLKK